MPRCMSLRLRLILLAGVCILPSIALLAGSQWQLREARKGEVQRQINELARSEASELDAIIGGARQFLTALQRTPAITDHNAPLCSAWLAKLRQDFPGYASIRADDLSGRAFCSSNPGQAAFEADAPFFHEVLSSGGFVVGGYELSPLTRQPELPLARTFTNDDGRIVGVLAVGLDLRWLAQDLASRLPPDASLTLRDGNGARLLHIAAGASEFTPNTGEASILGHAEAQGDLQVIASRPQSTAFSTLDHMTRDGALLIGLALLVACGLAAWIGRRFIRRPIDRLLATTERLRAGDLGARVQLAADASELAKLGDGLNALAMELQTRQLAQADAEAQLRQLAATLEQRVKDRTEALAQANESLAAEAAQRQRSQSELAQVQKLDAIGKLTGGVAHDFNNLLAAVLGSLELALARVEEPRLKRLLTVAEQAAQRGAKLTAHLLAFSRKQDLELRPVDMNAAITGMSDLLSRTLGKLIQLQFDLHESLWPATADPVQLEVALLNLAINARDAMPEGGTLSFRSRNVHVAPGPRAGVTLPHGDYAMVAVIDSGEGMPPDVQAKAFEPFFTTKQTGKGTGLGLSMVYGFARQAGGTVTIDSTPGRGTSIALYLPRAHTTIDMEQTVEAEQAGVPTLQILLVDDDSLVRETTAEMLRDMGHTVVEAANGPAALAILREPNSFDIALVDYAMPGMTGEHVAAQANLLRPTLPILLVTGYANAEAFRAWSDRGGHTLKKPFSADQLVEALRTVLEAAGTRGRAE